MVEGVGLENRLECVGTPRRGSNPLLVSSLTSERHAHREVEGIFGGDGANVNRDLVLCAGLGPRA